MFIIKYFVLPFGLPVFLIFSSCWKNPALIRDSVILIVLSVLLYAMTFVPVLVNIFDRLTQLSSDHYKSALPGEVMSGSCSVMLMRFATVLAVYVFAYFVLTGKFVPAH